MSRFTFGKRHVFKVIDGRLVELTDEQIAADDEETRRSPNGTLRVTAVDIDGGTLTIGAR